MEKQSRDLTREITVSEFQNIVKFILKKGDRLTYCNKFNNSPHYKMDEFNIYLDPIHQGINWSKDNLSTKISDYDQITIQDSNADIQYYHLRLSENKVTLENYYEKDIDSMKKVLLAVYLPKIKNEFGIY